MSISSLYVNGLLPMPALLVDPNLMEHIGEGMLAGFAPVAQLGKTLETLETAIGEEAPHFHEPFAAASSDIRRMLAGNGTPEEFQEAQARVADLLGKLRERRLLDPVMKATGWKSHSEIRPALAQTDINALSYLVKLAEFAGRVTQDVERRSDALFGAARFLRNAMNEAHFVAPAFFSDRGGPTFVYGSTGGYAASLLLVAPFRLPDSLPTTSGGQRIMISEESLYAPGVVSLAGVMAGLSGLLAFGHPATALPMVVHFVTYDEEKGFERENARRFVETFLSRKKGKTEEPKFEVVVEISPDPRANAQDPIVSRRIFSEKKHALVGVGGEANWIKALALSGFANHLGVGKFAQAGRFTDLLVEHFGPFPHYRLSLGDENCEAGAEDENVGIPLFVSFIRLLAGYFYLLKPPAKRRAEVEGESAA